MSTEWRQARPGEWWLMFTDAPPIPDDCSMPMRDGCGHPPQAYVSFPANLNGDPFDEGCLHYYSLYNGAMPQENADDEDYLHICGVDGLDDLIDELTALREALYAARPVPSSEEEPGDTNKETKT